MNLKPSIYQGLPVALLTQHGKQDLVRPILEATLGCHLIHTDGYDTDVLGTFTRDVARPGSQLEACRRKARLGMALTGSTLGVASEGAFGPDPYTGWMAWDTEALLWVDATQGLEVIGMAQGPAQSLHRVVSTPEELVQFAAEARFPAHHLVLRPDHADHPDLYKDLSDQDSLQSAFHAARAASRSDRVFVENDLRAHCNPTRQDIIRKAAHDLVQKLTSLCPQCHAPGYGIERKVPGLRCKTCGHPTRLPVADIWQCAVCAHQEHRDTAHGWADPGQCDRCNP
jgi:hypothetical protein